MHEPYHIPVVVSQQGDKRPASNVPWFLHHRGA